MYWRGEIPAVFYKFYLARENFLKTAWACQREFFHAGRCRCSGYFKSHLYPAFLLIMSYVTRRLFMIALTGITGAGKVSEYERRLLR
jgi:hypothetical protein